MLIKECQMNFVNEMTALKKYITTFYSRADAEHAVTPEADGQRPFLYSMVVSKRINSDWIAEDCAAVMDAVEQGRYEIVPSHRKGEVDLIAEVFGSTEQRDGT